MSDFFNSRHGIIPRVHWRRYHKLLRFADVAQDLVVGVLGIRARAIRRAEALPVQRVLIAAVEVPGREADLARMIERLRDTRHAVTVATTSMQSRGKMANINSAIAPFDMEQFDWLLVVDDDVEFAPGFVDLLLAEAAFRDFRLSMPAHRELSFTTFLITRRHWATASRRTGYVEVGPVTLFHRSVFSDIIPFPELRWAWGIDVHWAHLAAARSWPIGIVDVAPVRHIRPVAATYPRGDASNEAEAFLAANSDYLPSTAILRNITRYR